LHATPPNVAASDDPVEPKKDQCCRHCEPNLAKGQYNFQESSKENDRSDRQCMPKRNRSQGLDHSFAAALLHTARYGEQPAHSGIYAVERAEKEECAPGPERATTHA
jgi:hypothetical protein